MSSPFPRIGSIVFETRSRMFDRTPQDAFLPSVDKHLQEVAVARRLRTQYNQQIFVLPEKKQETALVVSTTGETTKRPSSLSTAGVLARLQLQKEAEENKPQGILVKAKQQATIPTPKWHAPWKLSTVLSSHLGWVRCVAFDPTNEMFATGGGDRVIKVWDLAKSSVGASDALKITLTGHISPVRGLAFRIGIHTSFQPER
ncbi:hypothetical protein MHU86_4858 [Fragilaria crotonensis]|nr:hypothetical protein MHU86_4858 [Fragilaria crotonensis]